MLVAHDRQAREITEMPLAVGVNVDGTPNVRTLSLRLIDHTGDKRSVSFKISPVATDAGIQAFVAEFAGLTQAVVWSVHDTSEYGVIPTVTGATSDAHSSVFDNIVVLYKDASKNATDLFLPAPIEALILAGDVVDVSNTDFNNMTNALLNAIATIGIPIQARFSERREINTAVPM